MKQKLFSGKAFLNNYLAAIIALLISVSSFAQVGTGPMTQRQVKGLPDSLLSKADKSTTISINGGTAQDLSANRSFTIPPNPNVAPFTSNNKFIRIASGGSKTYYSRNKRRSYYMGILRQYHRA